MAHGGYRKKKPKTRTISIPQRPADPPYPSILRLNPFWRGSLQPLDPIPSSTPSPQEGRPCPAEVVVVAKLVVDHALLPAHARRTACNLAVVCRAVHNEVKESLGSVLVWREKAGISYEKRTQAFSSFLKDHERVNAVRHLAVDNEHRAVHLSEVFREKAHNNLLSVTTPTPGSRRVHLLGASESTCLYRWMPATLNAARFVPSRIEPTLPSRITVVTHFDPVSRGPGLPTTTSRDLVTSDELYNDAIPPSPTSLGPVTGITIRPNRLDLPNAFPLFAIRGLATSLSLANAEVQRRIWAEGTKEEGCAVLAVEGYGTWKNRVDVCDLIDDLTDSYHPALNITLAIDLRCDREDEIPDLEQAEELVEGLIDSYGFALFKLLYPSSEKQAANTPSLVGFACNPELRISIRHPLATQQMCVKLEPETHGERVVVSYEGIPDEKGRLECFELWELGWADEKEGTLECHRIG